MTTTSPFTVDELLERLLFHWGRLPDVAAEFAAWDELEQLDFLMEWPIQEDDFDLLAEQIAAGSATREQRQRFEKLLVLIEQNQPILDELMGAGPRSDRHAKPEWRRDS